MFFKSCMQRLKKVLKCQGLLLCWFFYSLNCVAVEESKKEPIRYSLQLMQSTDLALLESKIPYLSHSLAMSLRILRRDDMYFLRYGEFDTLEDAKNNIPRIKSIGYPKVNLRKMGDDLNRDELIAEYNRQEKTDALHKVQRNADQKPKQNTIPLIVKDSGNSLDNAMDANIRFQLDQAWTALKYGELEAACDIFEQTSLDKSFQQETQFGLMFCYSQMQQSEKMVAVLELLVAQQYRLDETLPLLIKTLHEQGELKRAAHYAKRWGDDPENRWVKKLNEEAAHEVFLQAQEEEDNDKVSAFVETHIIALQNCDMAVTFFQVAGYFKKQQLHQEARNLYGDILKHCYQLWPLRLGVYYELNTLESIKTRRTRLEKEKSRHDLPPQYRDKLAIYETDMLLAHANSLKKGSPAAYKIYQDILALQPDHQNTQIALAWWYYHDKNVEQSLHRFERLYKKTPLNRSVQSGLGYSLLILHKTDRAIALAQDTGLKNLELDALKQKLWTTDLKDNEADTVIGQILVIDAHDKDALTALAWIHYNRSEFKKSADIFRHLMTHYPKQSSFYYGLSYCLIAMDEVDETEQIMASVALIEGEGLHADRRIIMQALINKKVARSPKTLEQRRSQAWQLYHQEEVDAALVEFTAILHEQPDATTAMIILDLTEQQYGQEKQQQFLQSLADSEDTALSNVASKIYFNQGWPVLSAQTVSDENALYHNADSTWLAINAFHHFKNGESSTSKLTRDFLQLQIGGAFAEGLRWQLQLMPEKLDADTSQSSPTIGRDFLTTLDSDRIMTKATVYTPELLISKEGYAAYSLQLGLTPLDGPITETFTFELGLTRPQWGLDIHQLAIKESMLSYIGLLDPFTDDAWGRVVRTGIEGNKSWDVNHQRWLSLSAGYDYYHGENVIDNQAVKASAAWGEYRTLTNGGWNKGLFASAEHFENNSNFYTYGHGGYYSPDVLFSIGPLINYETQQHQTSWFIAELSLSWFYAQTDDADVYPKDMSTEQYLGDDDSGVGYRFLIEGRKLINPYADIGALIFSQQSADYREWVASIGFRLFFKPHKGLIPHKRLWDKHLID